jgi:hypothetical protein
MGNYSPKAIPRGRKIFGQSLVETALLFPLLMILLSGLFEFGFFLNQYLAVADSARNAARFASDSLYSTTDNISDCKLTHNFYRQTACLVIDELKGEQPTIVMCLPGVTSPPASHCPRSLGMMDDVIISVFSITRHPALDIKRFPTDAGDMGWSYYADINGDAQGSGRSYPHVSRFGTYGASSSDIEQLLESGAPNSSLVIVEVYYHNYQILALPWFTAFIPDPILLSSYASWPQSSAVPTDTPEP